MTFDLESYIKQQEKHYDFPKQLQYNSYRDQQRGVDVIQVYFRYGPFADEVEYMTSDKFAFEIATTDPQARGVTTNDAMADMKKREVEDALTMMESTWKDAFNYVYWQGVPYAMNEEERVFTVKCELCHTARSIEKPGDFEYRHDLYMIYLLGEITHDCCDGWEPVEQFDRSMIVAEGEHLPRVRKDRKI